MPELHDAHAIPEQDEPSLLERWHRLTAQQHAYLIGALVAEAVTDPALRAHLEALLAEAASQPAVDIADAVDTTPVEPSPVHQVLIPLDGPPRPLCGGTGRSVMRSEDVTCPACREWGDARTPQAELPRPITSAKIRLGDVVQDDDGDLWTATYGLVMSCTTPTGSILQEAPESLGVVFGPLTLIERPEPAPESAPVESRTEWGVRYAWQGEEPKVEPVEDGREAALSFRRHLLDMEAVDPTLVSRTYTVPAWTPDGAQ